MKRRVVLMTVATSIALLAAACTAGGGTDELPATVDPNEEHDPVTLEMWIPFSADHEVAGRPGGLRCLHRGISLDHDRRDDRCRGRREGARRDPGRHAARRDDVMGTGRSGGVPVTPARGRTSPRTSSRTGWSSRITSRRPWSGTRASAASGVPSRSSPMRSVCTTTGISWRRRGTPNPENLFRAHGDGQGPDRVQRGWIDQGRGLRPVVRGTTTSTAIR